MDQILPSGASITIIHFTYDVGGEWRIACMPNMVEFHETQYHRNYLRSNEPRAVSCPQCNKTETFKVAHARVSGGK